jgi:hypothetical protein
MRKICRPEEGERWVRRAIRLNPLHRPVLTGWTFPVRGVARVAA